MISFRTLLAALFLVAMSNAFAPTTVGRSLEVASSKTALSFGFLKELGLEKPSWLPDFGGSKSEDPAPEETEEEGAEEEAEDTVEE